MTLTKKRIVVIASTITFLVVVYCLINQEGFNCRHTEIDVNSGDVRESRYFAFVKIHEKVVRTGFSDRAREFGLVTLNPKWRRTATETFIIRSHTNYKCGGTINSCRLLMQIVDQCNAKQEIQRNAIRDMLNCLQTEYPKKQMGKIVSEVFDTECL